MKRRKQHEHAPKHTGPEGVWLNIDGTAQLREVCRCGFDRFIDETSRQPVTGWREPLPYRSFYP